MHVRHRIFWKQLFCVLLRYCKQLLGPWSVLWFGNVCACEEDGWSTASCSTPLCPSLMGCNGNGACTAPRDMHMLLRIWGALGAVWWSVVPRCRNVTVMVCALMRRRANVLMGTRAKIARFQTALVSLTALAMVLVSCQMQQWIRWLLV